MPELPEVETVRRGLAPHIESAVIERVILKRKDLRFPFAARFAERLKGARFRQVERRAKYLIFHLSGGQVLLAHLGMSGRFRFEAGKTKANPGAFYDDTPAATKHDHVVFELKGGKRLIYNDARRFGFMELISEDELGTRFAALGVEPLSSALTGKKLQNLFAHKKVAVKLALLDQSLVAGIGNIYACEALFEAKISPRKPAGRVSAMEAAQLASAIKKVLKKAIRFGGSTLRDFKHADGKSGNFQSKFNVYDRTGKPCLHCKTGIERFTQGGRSTFFCPRCQR